MIGAHIIIGLIFVRSMGLVFIFWVICCPFVFEFGLDVSFLVGLASFGFSTSLYYEVFGPIFVQGGVLATLGAQVVWELFARISWRAHVLARLGLRLVRKLRVMWSTSTPTSLFKEAENANGAKVT